MSWTHLEDTQPRGRRQYVCDACGRRIRKGARHVRRTGVMDGEFVATRMHAVCEAATHDWDWYDWECHEPGRDFDEELGLPLIPAQLPASNSQLPTPNCP